MDTHSYTAIVANKNSVSNKIPNNFEYNSNFESEILTAESEHFSGKSKQIHAFNGARLVVLKKNNGLVYKNGGWRQDPSYVAKLIKKYNPRIVIAAGDLGTGKTQTVISLANELYNGQCAVLSHRRELARQTSARACIAYHDDVKADARLGEEVSAFAGCIHSLHTLISLKTTQTAFGGLFVVDESESVAAELTQKYVKNESLTLQAFRSAVVHSALTILSDAHAGANTRYLLDYAGISMGDVLVIETDVNILDGYTVQLYEDNLAIAPHLRDTKAQLFNKIIADLKSGLKVTVVSLSKATLKELDDAVSKSGLCISKILVDGDNSHESARLLSADTYGNYTLVMISPSMSTGVSFDKDNADSVYVFAPNANGTGTPYDALQAMLRDRAPKHKTISVYLQDTYTASSMADAYIANKQRLEHLTDILLKSNSESAKAALSQYYDTRPNLAAAIDALANIESNSALSKQDFKNILVSALEQKGAVVIAPISNVELPKKERAYTNADRKAFKDAAKKRPKEAASIAPKLSDEQSDTLKAFDNDGEKGEVSTALDLTSKEKVAAAITRHRVERELVIDFDTMGNDDKMDVLTKVLDKGLIKKLQRFDLMIANRNDVKRVVGAAMIGVKAANCKIGFVAKLSSDRMAWLEQRHYGLMALKAAGVTVACGCLVWDGETLIDLGLDRANSWLSAIGKSPEKIANAGLSTDLIETITKFFGVTIRQTKKGAIIDAAAMRELIAMVNRRQNASQNLINAMCKTYDDFLSRNESAWIPDHTNDNTNGAYEKWEKAKTRLIAGWIEAGRNKWEVSPLYIQNFRNEVDAILGFDSKLIRIIAQSWDDSLVGKSH